MLTDLDRTKRAAPAHPIADVLRERWSPRAFSARVPSDEALRCVFEAARWAASSYNEQPWRFVVVRQGSEAFDRVAESLTGFNRKWAPSAPVLVVTVAKQTFTKNGKPNAHAWHDVGLALGNLSVQATLMELYLHMMAGFDEPSVRDALQVPNGYAIVHVSALGYLGDPSALPDGLAEKERAARARKPQSEWLFEGQWGEAAFTSST